MRSSWLLLSMAAHATALGVAVGVGAYASAELRPRAPHVELQPTIASPPPAPPPRSVPPLAEESPPDEPLPPDPPLVRAIEPPARPAPAPVPYLPEPLAPTLERVVVTAPPPPAEAPPPAAVAADPAATVPAQRCADNPPPNYPDRDRRLGHEGTVVLRVLVDADGVVKRVDVQAPSPHPGLDREAVRAVWHWRFAPARRHGRPVPSETDVEVEFRLDG